MQRIRFVALSSAALVLVLAGTSLNASDPVAVYARIDRVVLGPDAQAPATVQVFGVFSIARSDDPNLYQDPARGYLYFTLPAADAALARREWNDLKEVAGTKQIVAFGTRWRGTPRLRATTDRPDAPDTYALGTGVRKVNGDTNYAPVRGLVTARH